MDDDDLTVTEIHNWYNNLIKRFGWVAISAKNGIEKDNYKKEVIDVMLKINSKIKNLFN